MPLASFFLRLLISVSLLASGSAHAGMAAMGGDVEVPAAHAGHDMPASGVPCHDLPQGGWVSQDAGVPATDAPSDAGPASSGEDLPDGCKAGSCRCACVHGLSPLVVEGQTGFRPTGSVRYLEAGAATYSSPALAQLIRPPIV